MSKRLGTKADRWKRYRSRHLPYIERVCKCGTSFQPKGTQELCVSCRTVKCAQCSREIVTDRRNRKYCSRRCLALAHIATLHANRGVKPRTYLVRHRTKHGCAEDREWRTAVFIRDGFTCQICSKVGGRLQADHIKPFSQFPWLRHELSNGRTLCVPCHQKTETYGSKARRSVAAKRLSQEVLIFEEK